MKKLLFYFILIPAFTLIGKSAFAQRPNISYTSPVTLTVGVAVTITPIHNNAVAVASASVTPALPSGLILNSDGTITGTPTVASTAATYNITPKNAAGNPQTATPLPTINITVNPAPPALTYASSTVFTLNAASTLTPGNTGGPPASSTINPALPTGLSISAAGVISGTPTVLSSPTTYTVSSGNVSGTTSSNAFTISVVSPPVFSYTPPGVYTKGIAISPLSPAISSGGPITSASTSPTLPAGLSIAADGTISGTPTVAAASASYTITAVNSAGGVGTATVTIQVVNPPVFSYTNPGTYTTGKAITALSPAVTSGGPLSNAGTSPALPPGLNISAAGVISGTPTAATGTTTYTVTVTGSAGGTGSATVVITVADPPVFSYAGPVIYTKGVAVSPLAPVVSSGGPIKTATVLPALPSGLSLAADGTISGTPTAVTAAANYTITATNAAGGTGTATVNITVNDAAPALTYAASTTFNYGVAGTLTPVNGGGAVISATISPALPAGLSLSATGVISGTPTAPSPATSYVVTATNTGGSVNSNTFSITVYLAKPAFTYPSPNVYTAGTAIATLAPNSTGGGFVTYTVSPALPSGLSLDGTTGNISGTPTAYTAAANYVVTGTNASGSATATVNITINQKPVISYSPASYIFAVGTAIPSTIIPTNSGNPIPATAFGTGTALAVPGTNPQGLAFDAAGNLFVANNGGRVKEYPGATGTPVQVGPAFNVPAGLVFDLNGNAYVADDGTNTVIKLNSAGTVVTFPSPAFTSANAIAIDANDNIYVADNGAKTITGITPAGTVFLTISTNVSNPTGVAVDAAGNIYSLNNNTGTVTKYDKNGAYISTPVSGYINPNALTIDNNGNIYVGETSAASGRVDVYNPSGTLLTSVTGLRDPGGIAVDGSGNMYVADNTNSTLIKYPAAGGYYLNSPLPAGLNFNTNTGQFTGTPQYGFPATVFTVTATNANGSGSTNITFKCPTNRPNISYTPNNNIYVDGTAITTLTPVNTNGAAASYSINTPLPAGLLFNPNTGTISGTPTVVSPATVYTITATNSANTNTTTVTITVNPKPPIITYPTPVSYATGVALSITPTNTGDAASGFTVTPALPAGLSINGSTGVISGTPATPAAAANYTVTASNITGSGNFAVNITIVAPPVIAYTPSTNAYPVNVAITPIAPANTGGPVYPAGFNVGTTLTTGLTGVWGITTDASGNIFIVYPNSSGAGLCNEYNPAGTLIQQFSTTGLANPVGVAIAKDGSGNIFITGKSGKIYRYTSTGGSPTYLVSGISTYSKGGSNGLGMVIDGAGNLFSADDLDGIIWKYTAATTSLTQLVAKPATGITNPSGVGLDPGGNVYFVDLSSKSLLRYNSAGGYMSTIASGYTNPYSVYSDASGNIFAGGTSTAGTVTEYSPSGTVTGTITTTLNNPRGITESPQGILYITDFGSGLVLKYTPKFYVLSGGSGTLPAGLNFDSTTGTISGTPTTVTAATTYTITAYGFGHLPVSTTVTISCYNSYDWTGAQTGGNWNNAGNWRSGVVPTSTSDVTIGVNVPFTNPPVIVVSTSVKSVTLGNKGGQASSIYVGNGFALTVSGDITKQSDISSTAAYSTSNLLGLGTINAVNFYILANTVTAPGTYTDGVNSAIGNLILSGNIALTSINSTYATNAAFTVSGGITKLTGTTATAGIISTSNAAGSTTALNVTGGTLQWANPAPLAGLSAVAGANLVTTSGTGVIDYHGAAQTIYTDAAITGLTTGVSYHGLTISGTGVKTLNSGNLNIAGDFTNSLANDAANYITLTGNTVNFNGAAQSLAGGAGTGTAFNTVNFSGAGTKTMASGLFSVISSGTLNMLGSNTATVLNAGGLLTLVSDVNGSATVPAISGPSVTGNVNVQRYITGGAANYRGYRLLSSPVSTSLTSGIVNINYLLKSMYLTATTGSSVGFDGGTNPSLYLFRDNLVPSNTTYTGGNFRGVNNLTSAPSYTLDGDGSGFNIPAGNGYLVFFRGDRSAATFAAETTTSYIPTVTTLSATGTLNQGQITMKDWFTPASSNLDYSTVSGSANISGYNLAGNPYASSINWDTYNTTATTNGIYAPAVTPFVYILDSRSKNYNVYQANSGGGGTLASSGSNIIPSGQGFFVVATDASAKLVFNESAKISAQATAAAGNLFLAVQHNKLAVNHYLRLELLKDTLSKDGIIINFNKKADAKFNVNEDAPYKIGNGAVSLASRSADGVSLAINTTPYPTKARPIPLVNGAGASGTYTLKLSAVAHIPEVYDIWLKDAYKNDSLEIRHNPEYTFDVVKTDSGTYGGKRFSLIIRRDPARGLHLLNFYANKVTNAVTTSWTVENEADYTGFTLQKSTDGVNFITIDTLLSSNIGNYSYTDGHPQASNYYRLQLTDIDSTVSYSAIVPVMYSNTNKTSNNLVIYPNPTSGPISIAVNQGTVTTSGLLNQTTAVTQTATGKTYDIKITNMNGSVLKTVTSASATWQDNVGSLLPGTYIIQVLNHGSSSVVGRSTFVKL